MKCRNEKLSKQGITGTVILCLVFMFLNISVHAAEINREKFLSLFPEPPPGWTADSLHVEEIDADEYDPSALVDVLFGEKKIHYRGERTYRHKSNNGSVTIGICTSDCNNSMLIPRGDSLNDPALLKEYKEMGIEPFTHLSYNGMLSYDDLNRIEMIALDIDFCRIVVIGVNTFGDTDAAMTFLKNMDFEKIDTFMKSY